MKKPRLKKPKLGAPGVPKLPEKTRRLKRVLKKRAKTAEEKVNEAISNAPRITNETVSEHREEVLSTARKYIYPLQHSKHRIVRISAGLFVVGIVAFFVIIGLSLYRFQNTSTFVYDVTRIIPFPVAKAGSSWVSYESYLFELRRNMHYYRTQQAATFEGKDGQDQLKRLKTQAMQQVIQDAYVKQLAKQHKVSVSEREVSHQLDILRAQQRLGSSDTVFREVLNGFWGWDEADFRRELKQQLLQQAVAAKLDTKTQDQAQVALQQIQGGGDFAAVAGALSQDASTKANGGRYPAPVTLGSRELSPTITDALFKLQPGQVSDVVNTGYTLEILKLIEKTDTGLNAAHIQFNLADITAYTRPLETKNKPQRFVKI